MCLGIPGQVVELLDSENQLAKVEVTGVRRTINVALLENEHLQEGDWVLIHVGFALSKIDEAEARLTLDALKLVGQAYTDEAAAVRQSRITPTTSAIGG
jgi:hydrogenase expression/formation protein HypC